MQCKRCLNSDLNYFYLGSKGYYCRKCISFKRLLLEQEIESVDYQVSDQDYRVSYQFELTKHQKIISNQMLKLLINKKNVFLNCVCGAGKTEICLESISYFLSKSLKVCFAISRKEVVLELSQRFEKYFKNAVVTKICSGFTDNLKGDLIVCTTHQLYRFYQSFDLLILDEVDAYPFKNNEVLYNIALNSCRGNLVFSSATALDIKLDNFVELKLERRPHNQPLAIPKLTYGFKLFLYWKLLYTLNNRPRQMLVFVSSKASARNFYLALKKFINCQYVTSEHIDKQIIEAFRNKKIKVLFTTTILERGVTFSDIDVIVLNAESSIFDCASLIQIAGRVGRDYKYPKGRVDFYITNKNDSIIKAIKQIKKANKSLIA